MSLASRLLQMVREMERTILSSPDTSSTGNSTPTRAVVDYYVITPKGSKTRFSNRGVALSQMQGNPHSETAVLAYLQKQHPNATIQINDISFD